MWKESSYSKFGIILIFVPVFLFLIVFLLEFIINKKIPSTIFGKRLVTVCVMLGMLSLATFAVVSMWNSPEHSKIKVAVLFIPIYILLIGFIFHMLKNKR